MKAIDVRHDPNGALDEVVAQNATVHLERLGRNRWWLSITVGATVVQVHLDTPRALITGRAESA